MKRILLILLFPLLVHAQPQPDTFTIDRIDVAAGTGVPVQIVRSELRLQQERAYSEADLRAAIARVRRLPFVFDASYRLEPSVTTPLRWTLIVEIIDIAPANFGIDAIADEEGHTSYSYNATIGGHAFVPGGHVVDAAIVTGGFSEGGISAHALRLSYTAYDLLDRPGAFAIISIEKTYLRNDGSGQPDLAPSLTLGYPLTATQTLLFRAAQAGRRTEQELDDFDDPLVSDVASRFLELLWRRDTTDDPFFTRSGSLLTFGPSWTNDRFTGTLPIDDELEPFDRTSDAYALQATGSKYLPLGVRNTVFARVRAHGTVERTHEEKDDAPIFRRDFHDAEATLGIARNLTMTNRLHTRLELAAALRHLSTESLGHTITTTTQLASATWTLRHPWTTVRVSVVYEWE